MKNLKRFLIISLFSFIFVVSNVYALEKNIYYPNNLISKVQTTEWTTLMDNVATYLRNNASTFDNMHSSIDIANDKNVVYYTRIGSNIPSSPISIYIVNYADITYNRSYSYYSTTIYGLRLSLSFDQNYNITGYSQASYGSVGDGWENNLGAYTYFDYRLGENATGLMSNYTSTKQTDFLIGPNNIQLQYGSSINIYDYTYALNTDIIPSEPEPSYTMSQEILENGNVKLTFNFTNYETNNGYGFTITNKVSGEEYGIENPFTSIYPNIIPFGNTYEIILSYDTIINVSLSKYTLIEDTNLYDREPLYVDSYDISNIVFDNVQNPYFSIISQTQDNLIGRYNNTKNGDICGHIYSNNNVEWETNCNEVVDIDFSLNGYVEMYVKRNNNIIYSRKINYIAQNQEQPYITWNIEKQDFYSIVNWNIKNYDNQMTYRYSKDNGQTYTSWNNATENNYINVYDNNTIIIEIANNDQSIIYDTKAINVVNDISSLNNKNNTTNNIINKFNDIFNVNGNILQEIERYWRLLKNSKIYLIIFIPFITSIICAIIYLIRRA